jgi:hypothetical protein
VTADDPRARLAAACRALDTALQQRGHAIERLNTTLAARIPARTTTREQQ